MRNLHVASAAVAGVCLWSSVAWAELTVIYDSGTSQTLAPFLEVFGETPAPAASNRPPEPTDQIGAADLSRLLPIRSPGLTPGPVTPRPLRLPNGAALQRPFFLIGADKRSREWLARHRDRLQAIGAVGMLVQAESETDLETIAGIAAGLPILPASATDIARSLGLEHIPVLISRRGIEQ
jgi:integrating conjugative element protein (TIGR03765 family)